MNRRLEVGRDGESRATEWYLANGYEILDRNWRIRSGELDIVAHRCGVAVFCEVKTRSSVRFGRGLEAVGWKKQHRIRTLALAWLAASERHYREIRFDVADVDGDGAVEVIEGCF